jgi:AAA domain/DnaB-like helicase N terminal domain
VIAVTRRGKGSRRLGQPTAPAPAPPRQEGNTRIADGGDVAEVWTPPHDVDAEEQVLGAALRGHPDTLASLAADDFYRPAHRAIYRTVRQLADQGRVVDPVAVKGQLERAGGPNALADVGGLPFLHTLYAGVETVAAAPGHADTVCRLAASRRLLDAAIQIRQLVVEGMDPAGVVDKGSRLLSDAGNGAATGQEPDGAELDAFLDTAEPEYEWLVEDLVERQDRIGVTGGEGAGKSTLLRQVGVQLASGVHPFTLGPIAPLRVLLVDLESSSRHVRRELRKLRLAAAGAYAGGLVVVTRPQGLDLLGQPADADWLHREVAAAKPDVLAVGPVYKMAAGDPNKEEVARAVQQPLDNLRADHGCAVLLELHTGHAFNGGRRPERPIGASAWLRWPEFGFHLRADGSLSRWRADRDSRAWPAALKRGGAWPWTVEENAREVLWARILDYVDATTGVPSERELADALEEPKTTVHRVLKAHEPEWQRLVGTLGSSDE